MKNAKKLCSLLLALMMLPLLVACRTEETPASFNPNVRSYQEKEASLRDAAITDETAGLVGSDPAGSAGYAVFFSICDSNSRAFVYTGTGNTLEIAWDAADVAAEAALQENGLEPLWVKADIVASSNTYSLEEVGKKVYSARHEFFRYGVAFDKNFETALLEAEMNGAKIYEYENGGIDFKYLNNYLKNANREPLEDLPNKLTLFQCLGWFCDETNTVYKMDNDGLEYGRRAVETIDAAYAEDLIMKASGFLMDQIGDDGKFVYGYYPRFDNEIENYNIVRHSSTIWSLLCRYRMAPSEELKELIELAVDYMLTQVVYADEETAYLLEEKSNEIKLGGCGVALIMLTEYSDIFNTDRYQDVCTHLGNGILTMLNQESGEYYHVLNGDFTKKEAFRTVYYDGEATFGLCRLYNLTTDEKWLNAAKAAVNHFIEADYTQYKDHWIAYSMNEITKHIPDNPEYYAFAMRNVQDNLESIRERDTTYHTYLELLMAGFETYDRMLANGIEPVGIDKNEFLLTIYTRADRMLDGFFFPEYAMYMKNPARILNTFMVRHDGYRIRIDDVQHNIGAYYLYWKNYDSMVAHGLLECRE